MSGPASIGTKIRTLRMEKSITQVELAKTVGLGQTAISQIERDVTQPTIKNLMRLAEALDCQPADLLAG